MMGLCMKQFEKMGWIHQVFLGLIVCAVMTPSQAMSVRERYLMQHPQVAATPEVEKTAPAQVVKHSRKHHAGEKVMHKKTTPVRQKAAQHRHHKIQKSTEKHSRVQPAKSHHQRVIVPKHHKSQFDNQQARDAEAALNHRNVKPVAHASRHQVIHVKSAKKQTAKHVRHAVSKKHHRHH